MTSYDLLLLEKSALYHKVAFVLGTDMNKNIVPLPIFNDNYIWFIPDKTNNSAVCVDPGEASALLLALKQYQVTLEAILITHHHLDHIGGVDDIINQHPNVKVYGPKDNRISSVTHSVVQDKNIKLETLNLDIQVIETPGHTETHVCYFAPAIHGSAPLLFCGDTLFSGGCGRLLGGTANQLYHSLQTLKQLPNETQVYCTHEYTRSNLAFYHSLSTNNEVLKTTLEYLNQQQHLLSLPSTIAQEKQINPFLRSNTEELQLFFSDELEDLSPLSIFKALRKMKDSF